MIRSHMQHLRSDIFPNVGDHLGSSELSKYDITECFSIPESVIFGICWNCQIAPLSVVGIVFAVTDELISLFFNNT